MEQRIIHVRETDFTICTWKIGQVVQELNKEDFELTFVTTQSDSNKLHMPTSAILVFTKK